MSMQQKPDPLPELIPLLHPPTDLGAAYTLEQHDVDALLQSLGDQRDVELLPLLQEVFVYPWAEVWTQSFTEVLYPTNSGARPFVLGFLRLKTHLEKSAKNR